MAHGRCYDCKVVGLLVARTLRARRDNLCGACGRQRKANSDPTYRLKKTLSTHNSRSSTGRVSLQEAYHLLCLQGFKCMYCRTTLSHKKFSVDHIIPVVAGGKHQVENIAIVCATCNSSKQHIDVRKWMARKGYELRPLLEERLACLQPSL